MDQALIEFRKAAGTRESRPLRAAGLVFANAAAAGSRVLANPPRHGRGRAAGRGGLGGRVLEPPSLDSRLEDPLAFSGDHPRTCAPHSARHHPATLVPVANEEAE